MTLAQAILLIPPGFYLQCECERSTDESDFGCGVFDEETSAKVGSVFGCASLYEKAPEMGWADPRHPADKFRDRIIVSISTDETDFEAFENLTVLMIVERYGTDRQKAEAKKKLDRQADRRRKPRVDSTAVKASW